MNIYDVLYKLVEARQWTDQERAEALIVISDMRTIGAFGTAAGRIEERDHDCERAGSLFPDSMRCQFCSKPMDPPPHACVPHATSPGGSNYSWRGSNVVVQMRCMTCNKEMPR